MPQSNSYQAAANSKANKNKSNQGGGGEEDGAEAEDAVNPDLVTFPASHPGHSVTAGHDLFSTQREHQQRTPPVVELMGPILRRKKVVSLPLGSGGDFFYSADANNNTNIGGGGGGGPRQQQQQQHPYHTTALAAANNNTRRAGRQRNVSYDPNRQQHGNAGSTNNGNVRQKQASYEGPTTRTTTQAATAAPTSPRNNTTTNNHHQYRQRQVTPTPTPQQQFMRGILRRRQISLDLLGPNDFFGVPEDQNSNSSNDAAERQALVGPSSETDIIEDEDIVTIAMDGDNEQGLPEGTRMPATLVEGDAEDEDEDEGAPLSTKGLFFPLRFSPRQVLFSSGGGGGGGGGHGGAPPPPHLASFSSSKPTTTDTTVEMEQQKELLQRYVDTHQQVKADILRLSTHMEAIPEEESSRRLSELLTKLDSCLTADTASTNGSSTTGSTRSAPTTTTTNNNIGANEVMEVVHEHEDSGDDNKDEDEDDSNEEEEDSKIVSIDSSSIEELMVVDADDDDPTIIRAGRSDKIKAGICFLVMLALTLITSLWETHLNDDAFILSPVGLACVTNCTGNLETRDFFEGHAHFEKGEVIDLIINLDANSVAELEEAHAVVEIIGVETGDVKVTHDFGAPAGDERQHYQHKLVVDFDDPHEDHIITVHSSVADVELSFTLLADVQKPLSEYSVIVAAVIMVFVYTFILLEVIHRTLIAIFGSMVALMFFFIMEGGHVESIKIIMLHLEWSTLGLLFGMMLIVGELSHTGIFEWLAVRLLIYSKGSYVRLLILLSTLTAVASAFLDNVTTMLLVAPVTIDMCHILGDIDPRPYLIAEVLLSNVGGTATLIGDPPNIIIGSAFSDIIGFIDFIIHLMPVIFIFCIPATLVLVVYLYRWYLTSSKMRVLDAALLKKTYQIYDEPRLLISGIVTFFVILMFFLHPVHHKDTAWIALLGAFVTVAFTNPHDIQSALRNHVEWDTLLFFAGLFILVEVCAQMGLLAAIGDALATYIEGQEEEKQLTVAITLLLWVSAFASSFLDNIPYTATMIPVIEILSDKLPNTLPLQTLAWALSLGACLGGNGTLLGASANIVTAGISTNKGYEISFVNFLYPGMLTMILTVAISNVYMLIRYVWAA